MHGKKLVLLTELPGGKRLAALRRVEKLDGGQVVFDTEQDDRSQSIPARDCLPVKGGEDVAEKGLGLAVRSLTPADLKIGTAGDDEDGEADDLTVCEVFEITADAEVYVVRGPDQSTRNEIADRLREAVGPEPIVIACPPTYSLHHLAREQMRACGWVRADELDPDEDAPEDNESTPDDK